MDYITLEEFKKLPEYQSFIIENPSIGILKVQVFAANQAIPIPNTEIYIIKQIGNYNILFYKGITDSSGIIDNISLPAPNSDYNTDNFEIPKYTMYELVANNNELKEIKQYEISMFGDVKVLQYVKMNYNGGDNIAN